MPKKSTLAYVQKVSSALRRARVPSTTHKPLYIYKTLLDLILFITLLPYISANTLIYKAFSVSTSRPLRYPPTTLKCPTFFNKPHKPSQNVHTLVKRYKIVYTASVVTQTPKL